MKGKVFEAVVVAHVDEEGDPSLEIIWDDRRLLLTLNPSEVGKVDEPHGWCFTSKDHDKDGRIGIMTGDDLPSLVGPLYDLARWQAEHDEHLDADERAAKLGEIDRMRAKVARAVHPEVVAGPWDGGAEGGR